MTIQFIEAFKHPNIFMLVPENTKDITDIGALCSRYSRSTKSAKDIYKTEFLTNPDRGVEFYQKVLLEYGDESVMDMVGGGITICLENITILESTILLSHRLLGAIEKSTRYIPLTMKNCEPEGMDQMYKFITAFEQKVYDIKEENGFPEDKPTLNAIRAQALDETRHLIPLSAHTSLAITANIREWLHIIESNYDYVPSVLESVRQLLCKYYPVFFKRFNPNKSVEKIKFSEGGGDAKTWIPILTYTNVTEADVPLLQDMLASANLYRENRRDKLDRSFEQWIFGFKISTNIGIFREFHRHRFLSIYDVVFNGDPDTSTLGDVCVFFVTTNLRELAHLIELRSGTASHFEFRSIVLQMAELVRKVIGFKNIKNIFPFITTEEDTKLGRLAAEIRTEEKRKALGFGGTSDVI